MISKIFQLETLRKDEYGDSGYKVLSSSTINDKSFFPDPSMID